MRLAAACVLLAMHFGAALVQASTVRALLVASSGLKGQFVPLFSGVLADGGRIFFDGVTSAVVRKVGNTQVTLARTGDKPFDLSGRFTSFGSLAINDQGVVAFRANVSAAEGVSNAGVFVADGNSINRVATATARAVDIDTSGDVAFATTQGIFLYRAGDVTQLVHDNGPAPGGASFMLFRGRIILNDAGTIVFSARVTGAKDGLFAVTPDGTVTSIAVEGDTSSVGTIRTLNQGFPRAINASGAVAFVARVGTPSQREVLVREADGTVRVVAQIGDLVDGQQVDGLGDQFVGIDADSRVVFDATFGIFVRLVQASGSTLTAISEDITAQSRSFAWRLNGEAPIVWSADNGVLGFASAIATLIAPADVPDVGPVVAFGVPSANASGAVAAVATYHAFYQLAGQRLRTRLGVGDTISGSPVTDFDSCDAERGLTACFITQSSGTRALLTARGGKPWRRLLSQNEATPAGGTYQLTGSLAANGHTLLLADQTDPDTGATALLAIPTRGGTPRVVAKSGDAGPSGTTYASFNRIVTHAGRAVALITLAAGDTTQSLALFDATGRSLVRLVGVGDTLPDGTGALVDFASLAVARRRVVFAASLTGGNTASALFEWNGHTMTRVASELETAPGDGTFASFTRAVVVANATGFAFLVPVLGSDNVEREVLFRSRRGRTERLLATGDLNPLGGTYGSVILVPGEALFFVRNALLFAADVGDASGIVQRVLLQVRP